MKNTQPALNIGAMKKVKPLKVGRKEAVCPFKQLTVAITTRALFDLEDSHQVFEEKGLKEYMKYQVSNETKILNPGVAFNLIRKILGLKIKVGNNDEYLANVVIISRNQPDASVRIFNSIEHYGLRLSSAVFTGGNDPWKYIPAINSDLFLSANPKSVREVINAGYAAATLIPNTNKENKDKKGDDQLQLRIAFDGDAVLFNDKSQKVYESGGMDAFHKNEKDKKNRPLGGGPFKNMLLALNQIQNKFTEQDNKPIRVALITARSAPAHERTIKTFRKWGVEIDEAAFLGGADKLKFIQAFGADIFFDDQIKNCIPASEFMASGHVPYGVMNDD